VPALRKMGVFMPLRLSDDELTAVMAAARPLPVERRDSFLQEIAHTLRECGELGPGVVYRVCAEVQRRHDPPDLSRDASGMKSKYR
jgi:hypothetical protein